MQVSQAAPNLKPGEPSQNDLREFSDWLRIHQTADLRLFAEAQPQPWDWKRGKHEKTAYSSAIARRARSRYRARASGAEQRRQPTSARQEGPAHNANPRLHAEG